MSMTRTTGWLAAATLALAAFGAQAQAPRRPTSSSRRSRPTSSTTVKADKSIQAGDIQQGDRAGRPEGAALRQLPAHDRLGGRPLLAPGDARAAKAPAGRVQAAARAHVLRRAVAGEPGPDGRAEADALVRRPTPKSSCAPRSAARAIRSSSTIGSRRTGDSWKIYDVNVLGVWLVENYRNSFAQEIGANGIDGLIAKLAERNKSAAGAATKS